MASWLKAAEDLFEVVDRRAKLVVGDNPDEPAAPAPVSAGQGSQSKRSRQRAKKKQPTSEVSTAANTDKEQTTSEKLESREEPDGNKPLSLTEDIKDNPGVPSAKGDGYEQHHEGDRSTNETSLSGSISNDESKPVSDGAVAEPSSSTEANTSDSNSNVKIEEPTDIPDGGLDSTKGVETVTGDVPAVSDPNIIPEDPDSSRNLKALESQASPANALKEVDAQSKGELPPANALNKVDAQSKGEVPPANALNRVDAHSKGQVPPANALNRVDFPSKGQVPPANAPNKADAQPKDVGVVSRYDIQSEKHQEPKDIDSTMKVEEQLNEAQGLLQSAKSTGQSKEARLARVCAGLSSRLQEYKSENAQLEELLMSERELSKSYEAQIKQLQKDLSASKGEVSRVELNMVEALAAKNAEIETLVNSVDSLKKQAAMSEGNLSSLQANMESIMRNRELTETRMMQALREELAAAERRSEEERAAHNSIKLSFREREVELEQRAIEASTALARTQRTADDRAAKVADLEQKVALLEVECASLNQELQDMEARVRRGQKKAPEDASQTIQVQAWQEEVERARQSQREAESKLSSMDAEVQKMRVEMAAMKRDAEHYSRQEHMELEKRYRELTDLLYYKQTQLETMASEKAAAEFQLEKEVKRFHEAQLEAERSRSSRRASSSWEEEDNDMKTLEPLPLHHRHMAAASLQLQKAAKILDTGAVRATRFLWRYPTARIILLFYLVFVHLFLMYLLHRLQEQADTYTSKEDAESMGLLNQKLP